MVLKVKENSELLMTKEERKQAKKEKKKQLAAALAAADTSVRENAVEETETPSKKKKKKDNKEKSTPEEAVVSFEKKKKKRKHKDAENSEEAQETNVEPATKSKKAKFSLSLKGKDVSSGAGLPVYDAAESKPFVHKGKGPKIVIAQDSQAGSKKSAKSHKQHVDENQDGGGGQDETGKKKRRKRRKKDGFVHETKGMGKALRYLTTWKEDRDSWKFEKCRQIWLLHNMYNSERIAEKIFPTLLEYVESIKGGMRVKVLEDAKSKLAEYEKSQKMIEDNSEEKDSEETTRQSETADDVINKEDDIGKDGGDTPKKIKKKKKKKGAADEGGVAAAPVDIKMAERAQKVIDVLT